MSEIIKWIAIGIGTLCWFGAISLMLIIGGIIAYTTRESTNDHN